MIHTPWFVSYIATKWITQTHKPCTFSLEIIVINIPTPCDGLIYRFHDDVFKIWPTTFWPTGTEIFRFVLNISLNTTTAVPARLSKVCNAIHKKFYVTFTYIWCYVSTKYWIQYVVWQIINSLGNSSPSPNIEDNTTTTVLVWSIKCTTTRIQIL